jgi:hypothetical protein
MRARKKIAALLAGLAFRSGREGVGNGAAVSDFALRMSSMTWHFIPDCFSLYFRPRTFEAAHALSIAAILCPRWRMVRNLVIAMNMDFVVAFHV